MAGRKGPGVRAPGPARYLGGLYRRDVLRIAADERGADTSHPESRRLHERHAGRGSSERSQVLRSRVGRQHPKRCKITAAEREPGEQLITHVGPEHVRPETLRDDQESVAGLPSLARYA